MSGNTLTNGPGPNPVPRQSRPLNRRQERFVLAVLEGMTMVQAVRHAGYEVVSDDAARDAASRLLRNPSIRVAVEGARLRAVERMEMTAAKTLLRLHLVYLEAAEDRDWRAAIAALDRIARHQGVYERDNRQKQPSAEELAEYRRMLREMGVDFERLPIPQHPGGTDRVSGDVCGTGSR